MPFSRPNGLTQICNCKRVRSLVFTKYREEYDVIIVNDNLFRLVLARVNYVWSERVTGTCCWSISKIRQMVFQTWNSDRIGTVSANYGLWFSTSSMLWLAESWIMEISCNVASGMINRVIICTMTLNTTALNVPSVRARRIGNINQKFYRTGGNLLSFQSFDFGKWRDGHWSIVHRGSNVESVRNISNRF